MRRVPQPCTWASRVQANNRTTLVLNEKDFDLPILNEDQEAFATHMCLEQVLARMV